MGDSLARRGHHSFSLSLITSLLFGDPRILSHREEEGVMDLLLIVSFPISNFQGVVMTRIVKSYETVVEMFANE